MFKKVTQLASVALLALVALTARGQVFVAGTDYQVLPAAVPTKEAGKVEVVEAFGYLCPHCNAFEPMVHAWSQQLPEDTYFDSLPVVFGRSWEPLARAYYVAELLGVIDKVHQPLFDAVHKQKLRIRGPEELADIFANYGVDRDEFMKQYNSFAVGMKLKQGESRLRGYQVTGVPSMIVNGKYLVNTTMTGSHEKMLEVVDFLVEKERNQ